MSRRDVAVVGMACVFPGAGCVGAYWRNIVNGVDAIRELPADRWPGSRNLDLPREHDAHIDCRRGGFIETPYRFDAVRFRVMPNAVRKGDPDQFILLEVLAEALEDARIGEHDPRRARTDVIVGRGGYTSNKMMDLFLRADLIPRLEAFLSRRLTGLPASEVEQLVSDMKQCLCDPDPDNLATSIPNLVASRTANRLNLRGSAYIVDAACASSLISVEQGVRRLREGLCDIALAAGVNFTQIPAFWYLFTRVLALSSSGFIRPFDRRADGLLVGEGAGAVVLKRLEDAVRDGDRIHAVVKGAGSASDGNDAGILAPAAGGQVRALEQAYADAGVDPDTIGLLEAHGTGTQQGDLTEIESTRAFYGARGGGHATRVMGSVKSMIGHTMPAAGIASFIKTALALSNKVLPPSLHCERPHEALSDHPFYVSGRARPWVHPSGREPRRAGVNAFGFGGINAHVVLEEVVAPARAARRRPVDETSAPAALARPPRPVLQRPTELLAFAGDTPGEVAGRLRRASRFLREDRGGIEPQELAFSLAREIRGEARCKLALVAAGLDALPERLEALAADLEREGAPQANGADGLFFGADAAHPRGRIAGLFPGHAFPGLLGNYPDHLMTMCLHAPAAREVFDGVEARDGHPEDPLPTSFLLQPPDHLPDDERDRLRNRFAAWVTLGDPLESPAAARALRPDERLLSAMGMLASNEAAWRTLEPLGIPFDMVCGQSLGDVSALCAAGCVEFESAMQQLWGYLGVDLRGDDAGCLVLVCASEERIAPLLRRYDVEIAIHVSPETLVLGGSTERVTEIAGILHGQDVMCQVLPFPPIHTRRLRERQLRFADEYLDPVPLREPRLDVYSSLTTKPMSGEAEELRRLVFSNLSYPVRFWQTLRRMYDDGARIFIQIGTGNLSGNARGVLPDDAVTLAVDVDYRDPLTQLHHVIGTLFAAGVPLDLPAMYEPCSPQALPLDAPRPEAQAARGSVPLLLYWPPLQVEGQPEAAAATERPPQDGGRGPVAPQPEGRAGPMPFIGRVLEHDEGRRLVHLRRFDLDEDLYLADHAFVGCQHGKAVPESLPVVPMTVTMELFAETASLLLPGLRVIGLEQMRARRWMELDGGPLDVRVEAERVSEREGVVTVRVEAFAREACVASAQVRLSQRYRLSLELAFSQLSDARPFPMPAERLYTEHHFFHGTRFRCLEAIQARGRQGIVGEVVVGGSEGFLRSWGAGALTLDPVALDGAGQMLGAMFFDRGVFILPVGVERLELYRASPPPGTRVPVRVELTDYRAEERRLLAIMEAQDGAGNAWFRISGWQDQLFLHSGQLLRALRQPTRHTLADRQPLSGLPEGAVAMALPRSALRDAHPTILARIYLHERELPSFEAAGSGAPRREWMMGRIAAKDAVRRWLATGDGAPLPHPSRLEIVHDASGRPEVCIPGEEGRAMPAISIAHKPALAVALAADRPVGIDLEPSDGAARLRLEDFATSEEIERIERTVGHGPEWVTRLWCGKEAAAKALGTGLQGRPRSFRAVEVAADGALVVENGEPSRRIRVKTSQTNGWTFAVASIPPDGTGG